MWLFDLFKPLKKSLKMGIFCIRSLTSIYEISTGASDKKWMGGFISHSFCLIS